MKNFKLFTVIALSFLIFGCSVFPFERSIKENHFILENFRQDIRTPNEYIYLACYRNRQSDYSESKELIAGKHNLWVKAIFDIGGEAYVNFNVYLDAGKRYAFKRKVVDNKVSIWIVDTENFEIVSEILTTDLKIQPVVDNRIRIEQCKLSSI